MVGFHQFTKEVPLKSSRIRRAGALAAAGAVMFFIPLVAAVGPADAQIRFCTAVKGSPCIGPINGCALVLGGNNYAFVDNNDTIVNAKGETYACRNGHWVQVIKKEFAPEEQAMGTNFGRGVIFQGLKGDDTCDIITVGCP
jgi:hypothetical protein